MDVNGCFIELDDGTIYRKALYIYFWANYNELTASSLEIIVSKGNHPQMALIQVSEIL